MKYFLIKANYFRFETFFASVFRSNSITFSGQLEDHTDHFLRHQAKYLELLHYCEIQGRLLEDLLPQVSVQGGALELTPLYYSETENITHPKLCME